MQHYLNYKFTDSSSLVSTFDELPLWSASFGLLMLKHLAPERGITVADIGCGTGFPLLELAARYGNTSKFYGIDLWKNALARAREKIRNYELTNVTLLECSGEEIPLPDESLHLVVSSLGINNFAEPGKVFRECHRLLRPGGRLVITTNITGHWKEFYDVFAKTLEQLERQELAQELRKEERHRGTVESLSEMFQAGGFRVKNFVEESFKMRFTDGSAFFNHHFVKLGWLDAWRNLIPERERIQIFSKLEENLDAIAAASGHLLLTVPMVFMEGEK